MNKTVVFKCKTRFGENDYYEEEFEADKNMTEEEITRHFIDWMLENVGEDFTWYEKTLA